MSSESGQGPLAAAGIRVRDMVPADIPAVHELEERLFPVDAWPRQMFVDELSQPETRRYLIAETSDGIIGYAGLMCIEPIADVQTIAVVPEYEGKGIGSALLRELISEGRRRGAADLLLEVRADNPRAQQLYRRFGFEQIHVRRKYYRDGVDALIMRLELASVLAIHQDLVHQDDIRQDDIRQDAQDTGVAGRSAGAETGQTTPTEADQQ